MSGTEFNVWSSALTLVRCDVHCTNWIIRL